MVQPLGAVVLVSQSPRRKQLLQQAGLTVHTAAAHTAEDARGATPELQAIAIAAQKIAAVPQLPAHLAHLPRIAADTVVVLGDECLGKPANERAAWEMLMALSGASHRVVTGVVVQVGEDSASHIAVSTEVRFRPLSLAEVRAYVATGDPFDKAGGYGIQGLGGHLVHEVHGSLTNVIGLPLMETLRVLRPHLMPATR